MEYEARDRVFTDISDPWQPGKMHVGYGTCKKIKTRNNMRLYFLGIKKNGFPAFEELYTYPSTR